MEVPTDEDESEPESEEEYELSEKEQRLLHEAYDTYATTGQQWTQERQGWSASCRTSFADAGNVRSVVEKFIDLPDSWPLMRILIPLDGLSSQVERIIACVAAELSATYWSEERMIHGCNHFSMSNCGYRRENRGHFASKVARKDRSELLGDSLDKLIECLCLQYFGYGPYIWSFCTPRQGPGETQESKRQDRQQGW